MEKLNLETLTFDQIIALFDRGVIDENDVRSAFSLETSDSEPLPAFADEDFDNTPEVSTVMHGEFVTITTYDDYTGDDSISDLDQEQTRQLIIDLADAYHQQYGEFALATPSNKVEGHVGQDVKLSPTALAVTKRHNLFGSTAGEKLREY